MQLLDKDLRKKQNFFSRLKLSGKLPAQRELVTDVLDENGQLQVKSVAVDDEHEPP